MLIFFDVKSKQTIEIEALKLNNYLHNKKSPNSYNHFF